jgi:hypothetical protein
MGCDDALEVDEFVVVGDCIDDIVGVLDRQPTTGSTRSR